MEDDIVPEKPGRDRHQGFVDMLHHGRDAAKDALQIGMKFMADEKNRKMVFAIAGGIVSYVMKKKKEKS